MVVTFSSPLVQFFPKPIQGSLSFGYLCEGSYGVRPPFIHTIVSAPGLYKLEAAVESPSPPSDRTPVGGARVHFCSPDDAIEVFVYGFPVKIPKGMTVLQDCEVADVDISGFCYHGRLPIAGNCLVEVEKSPKSAASYAVPTLPGMKINMDTPIAERARVGLMEFLLIPLDCPICGPLVKTVMTHCIRVRFAIEVGMLGRGSGEEIGTYVEKLMTSELSGIMIDICPVGVAFKARNWELKDTERIDVTDAVGFCYDGLMRQWLNDPIRGGDGRF